MNLNEEVLDVLRDCTIDGNLIKLPSQQLDRKLYVSVDKALQYIGGKWNRKLGGHLFSEDPTEKLNLLLEKESVNKPSKNGYFPTPTPIIEQMLGYACIKRGMSILEPSAGQGHILDLLPTEDLTIIEIEPINRKILEDKGYKLDFDDFLKYNEKKFDRIIMNPPFENQADIDHVIHAFDLLKSNGILVSIMSVGVTFRENKKSKQFRELLEKYGSYEKLPENSFKTSGTGVNSIMVILQK